MTGDSQSGFLVIGVGNSDRGDDGIGPAVISRLRGRLPAGVSAIECRGDLLGLIDEWKGLTGVVLIDAMAPRGRGGRVERLDLIGESVPAEFAPSSTHAFGLAETVEIARSLNQLPRHLIAHLAEGERFGIGAPLSPAVAAVVDTVADRVLAELFRLLATGCTPDQRAASAAPSISTHGSVGCRAAKPQVLGINEKIETS